MVVERQAMVARGGHRWSWVVEKKVLGFGWAFGDEERVKIVFFTLKNVFIICRSRLASSSS